MAEAQRGVKNPHTYPVWVGDLHEAVTEKELFGIFSQCGRVFRCKVMQDERTGKSRGFGYVNFLLEKEAELAAQRLNGFQLWGMTIKTKGPHVLRSEGHLVESPPKVQMDAVDYRPFTDCAFFIQRLMCKNGKNCPYRHSKVALDTTAKCPGWKEKKCLNSGCPYRHPGGKEALKEQVRMLQAQQAISNPMKGLQKCGGRCGDTKCAALFESKEDLSNHIAAGTSRMPRCRHCHAIFLSGVEFQEHLQTCWAQKGSFSTDYSSDSPEIEVLSDSDTEDTFNEGEVPIVGRSSDNSAEGTSAKPKTTSGRRRRNRKSKNPKTKSTDIPLKKPSSSSEEFLMGGEDGYYKQLEPSFSLYSDSDDEEDDDDEGEVTYTIGELARLMSLNEQDMMEEEDLSDSKNEEEERKNDPTLRVKEISPPRDSKQRVRLEPVGIFWDIENCSVPLGKSAFAVADKMRKEFITGKREAEFMCVCDITKERKEVTDDLHKAQVTLVHVNAIAKNAADDKLRQSLRRFAHTYPAPATVVLISGDVNFSMELNDLIHLHNITVVLVHNLQASDALKVFANRLVIYDDFIKDVIPPSKQTGPNLSQIVIVSGLPRHMNASKISSRLDRLSDNCGGKVLRVDTGNGTARLLFRTNDTAVKALKRMNGEDVFGYKITTALEPPQPHPHQNMSRLAGPDLSKTFPPPIQNQKHGANAGLRTLPPPQNRVGNVPIQVPRPPVYASRPPPQPLLPNHPGPHHQQLILPPPRVQFDPRMRGPMIPYQQPPHLLPHPPPGPYGRPPMLMPIPPRPSLPPPPARPYFTRPPCANPKHLPRTSIPRPEGKILIFKIPPEDESIVNQSILSLQATAFFSAEHVILWHGYSELQVLLKLDFIQTAIRRKEEIIQALYEKGELQEQSATKFVETCTKSISDELHRHNVRWDVTTCGWSQEEEENKKIRSNVVQLLRRFPLCWTKFNKFKKKYSETYSSAISEMAIHTACRGAIQILSDPNSTDSQVIIFYEFSPLIKIPNDVKLHEKLKKDFTWLLQAQPEKKIKLLDFVTTFQNAQRNLLPTSVSGKMLQEVITSMPNISLIGKKPSNIYVTLNVVAGKTPIEPKAAAPVNLSAISAAFCHLLKAPGKNGLPLKNFQQEYQTFFHHSFRVGDYLPDENARLRDLIKACSGLKIVSVDLPNGKKEDRVYVEDGSDAAPQPLPVQPQPQPVTPPPVKKANVGASGLPQLSKSANVGAAGQPQPSKSANVGAAGQPQPSKSANVGAAGQPQLSKLANVGVAGQPQPSKLANVGAAGQPLPTRSATAGATGQRPSKSDSKKRKPTTLADISDNFRLLVEQSENKQIPYKKFQQEYQTYFHHSFRVSDFLLNEEAGVRDLVNLCIGVKIIIVISPNGKREERVCLEDVEPQPWPEIERSPSSLSTSSQSRKSKPKTLQEIADYFRILLENFENKRIPFKNIQQEYQTFFHHSFRVSTYLPGNVRLKDLIEACPGIKIVKQPDGAYEEFVCLASEMQVEKRESVSPVPGASSSYESYPPAILQQFKQDCIDVLSAVEGCSLPLNRFPEHYLKVRGVQFLLSNYKAKKMVHLMEAISDVVEVLHDGENKIVKLLIDTKKQCELQLEVLLYEQPQHSTTLDRFMLIYEKKYGQKLHFYGHAKLIKLLEDFPDTLKIEGSGPRRSVSLRPLKLFACEMTELLSSSPIPMPINKIVPAFKEKFGKDFVSSNYGFPKLIRALEALPKLIEIKGVGATRTVSLKPVAYYTSLFSSLSSASGSRSVTPPPSTTSSNTLPESHVFADEITALLMTTHTLQLSLPELTKKYNASFRSPKNLPKVESSELIRAVNNLPNFKVAGTGPTTYVYLATNLRDGPPIKSPQKTKAPEEEAKETIREEKPIEDTDIYQNMPELVVDTPVNFDNPALSVDSKLQGSPKSPPMSPPMSSPEDDEKRLSSETRRMLLCHREHAMTLLELVERFSAKGDPTTPSPESLQDTLNKFNPYTLNSAARKFEISHIPTDVGASMVQLNRTDCLWKLGEDLLHLFVYHPTANLSISISELETLYAKCFSKKLVTAVYAAKDIHQLLRARQLKKVIAVDATAQTCFPFEHYKQQVLAELLNELLFSRGDECHSLDSLSALYEDHFKAPLPLRVFNVKYISELVQLARVKESITLVSLPGMKFKPVLKPTALFVEQIRYLLTKHDGLLALDQLESAYVTAFGIPTNPEISRYLKRKIPHFANHVVNYASRKWVVWAPTGNPYPRHRRGNQDAAFSSANSFQTIIAEPAGMDVAGGPEDMQGHVSGTMDVTDSQESCRAENIENNHNPVDDVVDDSFPDLIDFSSMPETVISPKKEDEMELESRNNETGTKSESDQLDIGSMLSSNVEKPETSEGVRNNSAKPLDITFDPSPYDFLKDDPELMAELTKTSNDFAASASSSSGIPEEDLRILAQVLAKQRLQEMGSLAVATAAAAPTESSGDPSMVKVGEVPVLPQSADNGPVDYIKLGWNPEQVLAELHRVKERSDGILSPEQMEPFLDYFGEMSSRELERIEVLEAKSKKSKKGSGTRKKPNMAIRFPGQSQTPSSGHFEGPYSMSSMVNIPIDKLPEANFDDLSNSSSDGDKSPPIPINRDEYIRKLLQEENPLNANADKILGLCPESSSINRSAKVDANLNEDTLRPLVSNPGPGNFDALFSPACINDLAKDS